MAPVLTTIGAASARGFGFLGKTKSWQFSSLSSGTSSDLRTVANLYTPYWYYIAGDNGTFIEFFYDNSYTVAPSSGITNNLFCQMHWNGAVAGPSTHYSAQFCGTSGMIRGFAGGGGGSGPFATLPSGTAATIYGAASNVSNNATQNPYVQNYVICGSGGMLRRAYASAPYYDGQSGSWPVYASMTSSTMNNLWAVINTYNSSVGEEMAYIAGTSYLARLRTSSTSAELLLPITSYDYRCIAQNCINYPYSTNPPIVAAGLNGRAAAINPATGGVTEFQLPTVEHIYGIVGPTSSLDPWIAVGANGTVLITYATDGASGWLSLSSGSSATFYGVGSIYQDRTVIVGAGGVMRAMYLS